jgi:hypothetical protein
MDQLAWGRGLVIYLDRGRSGGALGTTTDVTLYQEVETAKRRLSIVDARQRVVESPAQITQGMLRQVNSIKVFIVSIDHADRLA